MQIRQRLSYQFITIVFFVLLLFSSSIYFLSADYRKSIFYERLSNKALSVSNLLIQVDEVDAELLKKIEKDNPVSLPNETIVIFDYQNDTLYQSTEQIEIHITPELLDRIRLEGEVFFTQGEYEVKGFLFAAKNDRFAVVAGAIDTYGKQRLRNLLNTLIGAFCAAMFLLIIAGNLYARQALRPISRLILQVKNISANSMNLRLDEGNKQDEIAQLASTFNQMLMRLERAFSMQKNFIANASHEMRTPLTSITGQLEVLLLQNRNTDEYMAAVKSVLEDIKQMNRTSDRLLILAQASSETSGSSFTQVRIDDVIWKARSELLHYNPNYNSIIEFDEKLDETQMVISGNESLLTTAILNLMENSCKYSDNHTSELLLKPQGKKIQLIFRDSGIGIENSDLKNITQPFFRGKNSMHVKGHGIGLSLVDSIVKIHNGKMQITSEPGKGTEITVVIPVVKF